MVEIMLILNNAVAFTCSLGHNIVALKMFAFYKLQSFIESLSKIYHYLLSYLVEDSKMCLFIPGKLKKQRNTTRLN